MYAYLPGLQLIIHTIKSWFLVCLLLCQFSGTVMSPMDHMDCSTPSFPVHHQLPEFIQTQVLQVGDAIQPSLPLSSPLLFLLPPSLVSTIRSFHMSQFFTSCRQSIGVLALASVLIMNIQQWFSFSTDWLDLLAVQGTLKSLLQYHNSKASILQCSAFFIVQLSHLYMTMEKP